MSTKNKIEDLLQKYSNNTLFRASVSAVPYIGGALDILLSSGIQVKSQERFLNFLVEIEKQIKGIDEKKIDHQFLESEKFYDLFVKSSNLAVRTRLRDKIKAYAKILTSSVSSEFTPNINAEDILNIIEGLTENDIKLIKLISHYLESKDVKKVNSDIVFKVSSFSEISNDFTDEFILFGILKLINNSLVVKHHVLSAPFHNSNFATTPMFDIVKDFIIK
ncbi:hypothetical protein FGF1_40670 [Flavobacteriaceae bacterium GF1]